MRPFGVESQNKTMRPLGLKCIVSYQCGGWMLESGLVLTVWVDAEQNGVVSGESLISGASRKV